MLPSCTSPLRSSRAARTCSSTAARPRRSPTKNSKSCGSSPVRFLPPRFLRCAHSDVVVAAIPHHYKQDVMPFEHFLRLYTWIGLDQQQDPSNYIDLRSLIAFLGKHMAFFKSAHSPDSAAFHSLRCRCAQVVLRPGLVAVLLARRGRAQSARTRCDHKLRVPLALF